MAGRDPFDFRPSTTPWAPPDPVDRAGSWTGRAAARPPAGWLLAALVVAGGAAAGAALAGGARGGVGVAVVCWVLAGPGAIGLISLYVVRDVRARSLPLYIRPSWIGALRAATVLAVIAGIGTSAWRIADWWGRL